MQEIKLKSSKNNNNNNKKTNNNPPNKQKRISKPQTLAEDMYT